MAPQIAGQPCEASALPPEQPDEKKAAAVIKYFEPIYSSLFNIVGYLTASSFVVGSIIGYWHLGIYLESEGITHAGDAALPILTNVGLAGAVLCAMVCSILTAPILVNRDIFVRYKSLRSRARWVFIYISRNHTFLLAFLSISFIVDDSYFYAGFLMFVVVIIFLIIYVKTYFMRQNNKAVESWRFLCSNILSAIWLSFFSRLTAEYLGSGFEILAFVISFLIFTIVTVPIWGQWLPEVSENPRRYLWLVTQAPLIVISSVLLMTSLDQARFASGTIRILKLGNDGNPTNLLLSKDSFDEVPSELKPDIIMQPSPLRTYPVCVVLEIGSKLYVRKAARRENGTWQCLRQKADDSTRLPVITFRTDHVLGMMPVSK